MNSYIQSLVKLISDTSDQNLIRDFLEGILTPQELHEIPKRLEIVSRLLAGEPQAQIAKDLGVGVATVTRGSRELKAGRFKVLR